MKRRVTLTVCDNCGADVPEKHGAAMRITPADGRVSAKQADLCDDCMAKMPGQTVARRRRSASTVAA